MEVERKLLTTIEAEFEPTTLWERKVGPSLVTRRRISIPHESPHERGETVPVLYTVVEVRRAAQVKLVYDKELAHHGIEVGAGGLLIDQEATRNRLGRPPGRFPEEFIENFPEGTVVVDPSNFGWQLGAFLIIEGRIIYLKNDGNIHGKFSVIGLTDKGWTATSLTLEKGEVLQQEARKLSAFNVGFSSPLVLREGRITPLEEIITDPRLLADLRNVVDFGVKRSLPGKFWLYLRELLPTSEAGGRRLIKGRVVVWRQKEMPTKKAKELQGIIEEYNLTPYLYIDTRKEFPRLVIVRQLPLNRIPVVGIGFNENRQLRIIAVDGRQRESAGVTIQELAWLAKNEGIDTLGLGSAGGDVAVVAKAKKGVEILNSPSNKDHKTRPLPSVLVISP